MESVTAYEIPNGSGIVVAAGSGNQVFFHGISCEAAGGDVHIRLRFGDGSGLSFYPIHLVDGESRADPPFPVGVTVPGDLYIEIDTPENLVGGAVFARTGS